MFDSLPDPATGHLENCPLTRVLAHEFAHWIVMQDFDIYPERLVLYGIDHGSDDLLVTKGGAVYFAKGLRCTWGEVVTHVSGVVGEVLYFTDDATAEKMLAELINDASCKTDLESAVTVLRAIVAEDVNVDAVRQKYLLQAISDARTHLLPLLPNLRDEVVRVVAMIRDTMAVDFRLERSSELADRLGGREPGWYG